MGHGDAGGVKGVLTRSKNKKVAGVTPWKTATLEDFTKEKEPATEMRRK